MPDFDFKYTIEDVPVEKMKPGKNVRKDPNETEILPLGESLLVRQLHPVILNPEYFIIDGWRRWLAAQKVAIKTLWAIITDRQLTRTELQIAQLMMSVHRCDLTGGELYTASYELLQLHSGWMAKDLAHQLKMSPSMITRVLSPSKCIEPVRKALMENRIGLSHCYEISKVPEDQQAALLEMKLNGASRGELASHRRKRSGRGTRSRDSVLQAKCLLPGGAFVAVGAKAMSMQLVVSCLTEALKAAKKGADEGYDVKTWESMMRDRAKGGGRKDSAA
jgi:ParB/RepB/Spo0J family partition protein